MSRRIFERMGAGARAFALCAALAVLSAARTQAQDKACRTLSAPLKVSLGARLGQARERVMRAWA